MTKFQFSLRTLLLLAITIGALVGFFFARRENAGLRVQIDGLKDELGMLEIGDPNKAWARAAPMRSYEPASAMRFRIYVPRGGNYRIGVQTTDVVADQVNPKKAEFQTINLPEKGEFSIEALMISESDGRGMYDVHVFYSNGGSTQFGNIFSWKQQGFAPHHYNVETTLQKSSEIDLSKSVILVAAKVQQIITTTGASTTTMATKAAGPGFLVWIEEEKKPQAE